MAKDPFENIRRIQEILNRINLPAQQIQKQFEIMQPLIDQAEIVRAAYGPIIEVFREQELYQFADIGLKLNETFEIWSSVATKIEKLNYFHIPIPVSIYPQLQELMSVIGLELEPEPEPREAHSDLLSYVTVRRPEEKREQRKWTWIELATFLMGVLMFIHGIYYEAYNRLQSEKQHTEIMAELQEQTRIQQHQLLIQQEALEIEKAKVEAMHSFIELIEPYIPDDQALPESCHGNNQ